MSFRPDRVLEPAAASGLRAGGALVASLFGDGAARALDLNMRVLVLTAYALTCLSACSLISTQTAPPVRADHPFLGRWTWTYKGCTEVYEHRADGTTSVMSGKEVGASKYTISDQPGQSGYYRLVDAVTRSNGKTGCDGTRGGTPVGDVAVLFVRFLPSGNEMLICNTESLDQCVGPLWRVH